MSGAQYQHLPADAPAVNEQQTVVVVEAQVERPVERPTEDSMVGNRKRQAGGCGCCACLALLFLLLFFLLPRNPTVVYQYTQLTAGHFTESVYRLRNNNFYSVEWSNPQIQIAFLNTLNGNYYFELLGQTWCSDDDAVKLDLCNENMTSTKWTTGAQATKNAAMPTTTFPIAVAQAAAQCELDGRVQLASTGTISAKTALGRKSTVRVSTKYYWAYC